jgi:nickel-dependent lactate racemase
MAESLSRFSGTQVDFAVNMVVNHREQILKIFSGHSIKSHLMGCRFLDKFYLARIGKPVDLIIASAGGYPTDINFIQAHKTLEHASKALKENGKMVVLAECPEGIGSDIFIRWLEYGTIKRMEDMLRKEFLVSGHTALCSMIKAKRFGIYLYSRLDKATVKKMCFTPVKNIQSTINRVIDGLPVNARVLILPEGYSIIPVITK